MKVAVAVFGCQSIARCGPYSKSCSPFMEYRCISTTRRIVSFLYLTCGTSRPSLNRTDQNVGVTDNVSPHYYVMDGVFVSIGDDDSAERCRLRTNAFELHKLRRRPCDVQRWYCIYSERNPESVGVSRHSGVSYNQYVRQRCVDPCRRGSRLSRLYMCSIKIPIFHLYRRL